MNKHFTLAAAILTGAMVTPAQTLQDRNAVFQHFRHRT